MASKETTIERYDTSLFFVIQRLLDTGTRLGYHIEKYLEPTIKFYEDFVGSNAAIQWIIAKEEPAYSKLQPGESASTETC
jgi:hypothetical protein